MDITGFTYLVFFSCVLVLHRLLQGSHRAQKYLLTAASYYFYCTIDWRFAALLIALTGINWAAGRVVATSTSDSAKRWAIGAAVLGSLGILFYFKYLNFFSDMLNGLTAWLGAGALVPLVDVILPVGISFMTFQAITYPIDLYRGQLGKPAGLLDFSFFMAFFPRLLAGPIVRASYFLPQLEQPAPVVSADQRFEGLALVLRGLVKKVLIADTLGAHLVDPAFANPDAFSAGFLWLAMFGYSFQVYLDLSGYTDMAIGAARMLGYRLPSNFNRPYLATSVSNFWQRWHISISSFFRDYLYVPLAAAWRAPSWVNLLIVFVAIGLWHGAGWNFVIYGLVHGTLVSAEHYRDQRRARLGVAPLVYRGTAFVMQVVMVFSLIALTRLLFRGGELELVTRFVTGMFSVGGGAFPLVAVGSTGTGRRRRPSLHAGRMARAHHVAWCRKRHRGSLPAPRLP